MNGQLRSLTGRGRTDHLLLRAEGADARFADRGIGDDDQSRSRRSAVEPSPEIFGVLGAFNKLEPVREFCSAGAKLRPGEVRLFYARRMPLIVRSGRAEDRDVPLP